MQISKIAEWNKEIVSMGHIQPTRASVRPLVEEQ